jgi:branched-subunit amino acid aminotransferase/4-amino-4-deoxychorismate lyase
MAIASEISASESPRQPVCWLDGRWLPEREARVPADDPSFLRGEGLFETLGVREGVALFVPRHWARLKRSAERAGLALSISAEEFAGVCRELSERNGIRGGRLRFTVSEKTAFATLEPWPFAPEAPLRLAISPYRVHSAWPVTRIKFTSRAGWSMALREAQSRGFDDALIVNERGEVCEASRANVFFATADKIITPPDASGLLPGVAREILLETLGKSIEARPVLLSELASFEGAFLTSSLRGPRAVGAVAFENGQEAIFAPEHPMVKRASEAFEAMVREEMATLCG